MFQNLRPTLIIANGCSSASLRISVKAAPHWSIHYCQGKFYFLNKKTPGSEFITATNGADQFEYESIELIETVYSWPAYEF